MRKISIHFYPCLIFVIVFCAFNGCSQREGLNSNKYRETQVLMGTIVHIDVCQDVQNTQEGMAAYKAAWERLKDIAWRMNVLDERSDVARINNSTGDPVLIGADTYMVLKHSQKYSRNTKGAFDITVWPLINLWKQSAKSNTLPTIEQIQKAQRAIGSNNIQLLPNNLVKRINPGTKIDLGGIAKGYAIDEVARIFRGYGILSFFIDAGGDIYVGGQNCSGKPWRVGIRDPRDRSTILNIVEVVDSAVTTSGNYEKYYTIANERWSHIIDPHSGFPQRNVISATVIAPTAMEADALATALCVLGGKPGTEFMNMLTERHASLIIVKDQSNRIKKFASENYASFETKR